MNLPPLALIGFAAAAAAASAQVPVFDNTGGLDPLTRGMLLYGSGTGLFSAGGAQFVAPSAFTLDRVEVGLWAISGATSVTASLYTDTQDAPGTFLDAVTISGIDTEAAAFYAFDFADTYSFTAGTKIWVTVVNATGTLVWSHNAASIGGIQQQFFSPNAADWDAGESENPQVALKVAAIPEPAASAALFGACGLIALVGYRKHRRS